MKNTFFLATTLTCIVCVSLLNAQDYSTMTLNFNNITTSNLNQNVTEIGGNEKLIDFGDYDNDGDMDVVIGVGQGAFGQRRNKLYQNDGGVLNEVSGSPVIPGFSPTDTSRGAFFADYDQDGYLDIIVINDSNSGTSTNDSPGKTKLFRNIDGTSFVNESERLSNQTGAACGGSIADFDQNGFMDLYMANYPGPSQDSLGLNNVSGNTPGNFTVSTSTHVPNDSDYTVNSRVADMNGDGKIDVLIGNLSAPDYIYYNDNNDAGSGIGDMKYAGAGAATSFSPAGASGYQLLHPADFNGDGMMDMFYANSNSSRADVIYVNTGNDANNKATFAIQSISSDLNGETNQASTPDLDNDGRPDLIVMSDARRPYIYRNTSENGEVSFIEWTPSSMTNVHAGWHANAADITGNMRNDIVVGAGANDFLFENLDSPLTDSASLAGGVLPTFHNSESIAITGRVAGGANTVLVADSIPSGARVSVLLRGESDLRLNVSGSNTVSSDRPGEHVDEAVEFVKSGNGNFNVTITNESPALFLGDANRDGNVNLLDVQIFVDALSGASNDLILDMNGDGAVNLLDVNLFVAAISGNQTAAFETEFVIEFLSRN